MSKNIFIELKGGLGNQLFQYSFFNFLKLKKNFNVNLNLSWFDLNKRSFLLDKFLKNFDSFNIDKQKRYFFGNEKIISFLLDNNLYIPSNLTGYWQSIKYAKYLKLTDFKDELLKDSSEKDYYIFHIRRGDFYKSRDHSIIPFEFYKRNFEIFKHKKIFLVSEEKKDANILKDFLNEKNVEIFQGDELTTFRFILNANGGIISNSTFCWWPVFLSKGKDWISSNYWRKNQSFINSKALIDKVLISNV